MSEGIPTGRHWLEAAEELKRESEPTRQRFRENYLASRREGETVRFRGSLSYGIICGVKDDRISAIESSRVTPH